jgi:L-threonylcarbamoyladenylate synthase
MILPGTDAQAIVQAVQRLKAGALVAFPTETVYGLGADAAQDTAVAAIYAAKGRPSDHPLIVHLGGARQAAHFAASVPDFAQALMAAFWPGPLTLILARRPGVAQACAAGQASIALRCPSHPVVMALLQACESEGLPGLAAPSANRFGHLSPTTARHVQDELGQELLILDGGPCSIGIESSIVDCTRAVPVLLRPGMLTRQQLADACGQRVLLPEELPPSVAGPAPRASGTLQAHYAPRAPLRLMDAVALQIALDLLGSDAAPIAVYARSLLRVRSPAIFYRRMPDDALATAQQLFGALRDFDARGARLIWVETPPEEASWEGVHDRLRRAAAA